LRLDRLEEIERGGGVRAAPAAIDSATEAFVLPDVSVA
jgi:hypothetical protein